MKTPTKRKPGQPRKPANERRVTISASVSPETAAALRRESELSGQSIGKRLDHWAAMFAEVVNPAEWERVARFNKENGLA